MAEPELTVFLCGDVMTGRGIDQVLPHPGQVLLREPYVDDARAYIDLAEAVNGPIPRPVDGSYVWGDALDELARVAPDARVVNLETSITSSDDYCRAKSIHYRMHPDNIQCLTTADIDVCVLANNHVLDFGHTGLHATLDTLAQTGVRAAGAGRNLAEARQPAIVDLGEKGRLVVFGFGTETSGIPPAWAAREDRPGVDFLPDLSEATARAVAERARLVKQPGDIVLASIHWGSNWGYAVPADQRRFARQLVDGGIDIVHGHSSHHARPIEVYRRRPIFYGCGDLLDDYEGISGYEEFRNDLRLMYFLTLHPIEGALLSLGMTPMRMQRFRLTRAAPSDARWIADTLDRVSRPFGSHVELGAGGTLALGLP